MASTATCLPSIHASYHSDRSLEVKAKVGGKIDEGPPKLPFATFRRPYVSLGEGGNKICKESRTVEKVNDYQLQDF
jgi:hypothetical protein